jgi:choline dehydrogenase-like flavoprotein
MSPEADWDYVIVGSGAGGGTLAARLAEAGRRVLVLEAGGDAVASKAARLPADYEVPAFHPFASENPAMSWSFFVRHYSDEMQQRRDPNFVAERDGVFYPRAGTLGGCTAHNAMILLRPHDVDWDGIATLTGDESWRASRMQDYFRRIEHCRYRPAWRWLSRLGVNPTGHGWNGWLSTERALPRSVFGDRQLLETILRSAVALGAMPLHVARLLGLSPLTAALIRLGLKRAVPSLAVDVLQFLSAQGLLGKLWWQVDDVFDPNDRRFEGGVEGLCYTPLTTRDHGRTGTRERLLDVASRHPDRLRLELDALATRLIFGDENRVVGVEYLKGERLYRAHTEPSAAAGERREARAAREVILAGGAFNTPQLLMLSGIGPRDELSRHGIKVRVASEGVGRNLQDRYEISVVNRMAADWTALAGARFDPGDPLYRVWAATRDGMYTSSGTAFAVARRSTAAKEAPDLFCMALLAHFAGYRPGYAEDIAAHHDSLSWTILKAHTINRRGEVTLRSADPRDPPDINFRYFGDGGDADDSDLRAVVEAIRFVRKLTEPLKRASPPLIVAEEQPGEHLQSDAELAQFVRDGAWGHHASCSCAIGPREAGGVIDSAFRVHGTTGLRIVDASVFPRIPGFFIASAVYMIAEKAAEVILRDSV